MPDSCFNLERAWVRKTKRNYAKFYWAIDIHDVIIEGKFSKNNEGKEFYPDAKEVLQFLSSREDMVIMLWTSGHMQPTNGIWHWLSENNIKVKYVNENPEMPNDALCDFSTKFAFDVMLEDKAGFVGETDWTIIKNKLKELGIWKTE